VPSTRTAGLQLGLATSYAGRQAPRHGNSTPRPELALSEDAGGSAIAGGSASFGGRAMPTVATRPIDVERLRRRSDRPRLRFELAIGPVMNGLRDPKPTCRSLTYNGMRVTPRPASRPVTCFPACRAMTCSIVCRSDGIQVHCRRRRGCAVRGQREMLRTISPPSLRIGPVRGHCRNSRTLPGQSCDSRRLCLFREPGGGRANDRLIS